MQGIFDSHAHYNDEAFHTDLPEVIGQMCQNGVIGAINCAGDAESSYRCVSLAERYRIFYAAVGVHPEFAGEVGGDWLSPIRSLLAEEKVVAIGEIGLDYHYDTPSRNSQLLVFEAQLQLAAESGFPVIVHSRDATEDTLTLLRKYRPAGVLHCFSGSVETMKEIVGLGMYIGFTGVVTFKNARRAKEVAAAVPPQRLLLETDCPYMAPEPFRGKRTTSDMIAYTAEAIGGVRGLTGQEVIDLARENTKRLFQLE